MAATAGISDETIAIVKATAPLVKEHVNEITSIFYPKMLGRHPVRKKKLLYRFVIVTLCFIPSVRSSSTSHTLFPISILIGVVQVL
jgi:hypothetical protein